MIPIISRYKNIKDYALLGNIQQYHFCKFRSNAVKADPVQCSGSNPA
jgi:hypothetical protein